MCCYFCFIAETQTKLINFVKSVQQQYPQEFDAVKKGLSPEQVQKLESCVAYTNGTAWLSTICFTETNGTA